MKGHHSAPLSPSPAVAAAKRRCSGMAAAVPPLVLCSVLLPLAFLLGLHRTGYGPEERAAVVISTELGLGKHKHLDGGMKHKLLKERVLLADGFTTYPLREERPVSCCVFSVSSDSSMLMFPKIMTSGSNGISGERSSRSKSRNLSAKSKEEIKGDFSKNRGPHTQRRYQLKDLSRRSMDTAVDGKENQGQEVVQEENPKSYELEYGSYCLWSVEHKEEMKDAIVKRLKDQLFMARAHYPSIAKLKHQERFTHELKQNIQEHEHMLSDTIADADLPPFFTKKLEKMEHIIERVKSCEVGCSNVERKLRQLLDITEDEAYFHTRQSAFLYHLGVQTMPKTHHCLSMRLTVEYFKSASLHRELLNEQTLEDPAFFHYVMFSRNVLAASTTINSTAMNSKDSGSVIFHLFTDTQNFYAMKHWFDRNSYLEAIVHVINIDNHNKLSKNVESIERQQLWPTEEFRVTFSNHSQPFQRQIKTEYISVFGHSQFLLPDLLPNLNRVVVLDDDLVVQKDLSSLWNLNMGDKVIGAVQFCGVRLGQLRAYIEEHNFNTDSCVWFSGLNVIELEKWRDLGITSLHGQLLQKEISVSHRLKALPRGLLAFQDLIYPLKDSWVQSGLGYDYGISRIDIEKAATLHYNGVMKPWLDLGIHDYKSYWRKYMTNGERFMAECNIH